MIGRGDLRVSIVRVVPPDRLCCDFDPGHRPPPDRHIRTLLARAGYHVRSVVRRRSASGKGWHVIVWTRPAPRSIMEAVALQAVIGSDPYREACNVLRARQASRVVRFWRQRINVLYDRDR